MVRKTQQLKVVGIVDEEPYGGMRTVSRGRIFLPVDHHGTAEHGAVHRHAQLAARRRQELHDADRARERPGQSSQVQDAISKMGFRTFSILDATKSLRRFFTVLDLFLGIFGSLALAVATLAIINTLVMAVLERRREIGVMKAIGASDGDVKKLFFAEAGAMGFFGGVLGIALGFAIGKAINIGTGFICNSPASRRAGLDPAALADRGSDCVLDRRQPAGWPLSRQPRREARSGADTEIRMRMEFYRLPFDLSS